MNNKGVTLLETLLVIGVLAILGAIGSGIYSGYSQNVELEANASAIISDLKSVQSKAINGEDGLKWGIHFINGADDKYEIFSTPTYYSDPLKIVKGTPYLSGGITFFSPSEGVSYDIIFNKILGTVDIQKQITLTFAGTNKIITVTTIGTIY